MRKDAGFSLIELLIVVAIILVIAAIAIPNFLRSKISANEAAAVSNVRTINTAETTYSITYLALGLCRRVDEAGLPDKWPANPGRRWSAGLGSRLLDATLCQGRLRIRNRKYQRQPDRDLPGNSRPDPTGTDR